MNSSDILDTRDTVKGLCKLASKLGYKDPCHQLANSDGSVVGDLLCFFEDNPGACQAVIDWTYDHAKSILADDYEEDEDEDGDDEEYEDDVLDCA